MIFSPRSTSPMYFEFKFTDSANFSWVSSASLRRERIAAPMVFRCGYFGDFFCFDFANRRKAMKSHLNRYTSNKLVFISLHVLPCGRITVFVSKRV